jgi:hypothetical protein
MSNITVDEAQAWAEKSKLDLVSELDGELEKQVASQVLARVAIAYDVSGWTTTYNTPQLLKTIICMFYVGWLYERTYSDDNNGPNVYGDKLLEMAETMLQNILDGITELPGVIPTLDSGSPSFYPTDLSSAQCPTPEDRSLGDAKFSMGIVF